MVREVDRLGALEMGVARHRPVQVRLRDLHDRLHQVQQCAPVALGVGSHEHGHVRGHLVVARAGGVQLPPHRADDLREPALDRHVDVLVVGLDDEAALLELAPDGLEAALELRQLLVLDDPDAREHARVSARLVEVERRQAVVEPDRRVEGAEERILGL